MRINIIVATDNNGVIGKDNTLIWHLPADLKNFKNLTTGHNVIMGRKTYESIGKPLPNRLNIVCTKQPNLILDKCIVVDSIQSAIKKADRNKDIFIIGGSQIYKQCLDLGIVDRIFLTKVWESFTGDSYFNFDMNKFTRKFRKDFEADSVNKYDYSYFVYEKN